ncbi:MAG: TonB-dependent receptor, partial [Bacteroidales bacterium]|nr:TonB-dependent receptor [Bacteroidales bacterium]
KNFLKKHTFYYGIESVYNNVSSVAFTEDINTGVNTPSAPRYPDGRNDYMNAAAYTSVKLNIGKKITLDAGARYTYTYLHSTIIDNSFYYFPFTEIKNSNDAFNGSLGIVIRPWKGSQINVNLSSGFRAPNLDDMAKVFDSEPGNIIVPNENLEPEYSNNLDLGFLQDFNHKFNFEITGFYTLLKDALVRRPGTFNGQEYMLYDGGFNQVYSLTNASEARLYGGSIFLNAKLSSLFSITTDFTYMKGEDIDGFPVRHIPPFYGGLHLIAEKKRWRGDFYMLYNGEISNENLAPEEQSKIYMYEMDDNGNPFSPAWYTINFKASAGIGKIFTFQAGVENILDHRYRPYSSGIVAPGRNFYISLKIAIS